MSEALAVRAAPAADLTRPIVAIAREDFAPAQERMIALAESRIAEHQASVDDLTENLAIAKRNKWRHTGLQRALKLAQRMVTYYTSARAALAEGYMVMPDLMCDVYAVRVRDTSTVPGGVSRLHWTPPAPDVLADPSIPAGSGTYVSDRPAVTFHSTEETDSGGSKNTRYHVEPYDTLPPEAPMVLARPVLLEAASRAMALRIFDEIGIVGVTRRSKKGDPLLVGRIIHPKTGLRTAFFLAWWLRPADF